MKKIGTTGNLIVSAIEITEDGRILPECEYDEGAGKPLLKAGA